jgi:predicted amidohydrolase
VKVAGIQLHIAWEDPEESLARAATLLQEAAGRGAQLLVLPEMFATGFSMRSHAMAGHAATIRTFLAGTASAYGVWVLGGFAEPGEERPVNACSVFNPNGREILHYRKIHPFSAAREPDHYESGSHLATVEILGVRVTPLICYDLRFPELFRIAADRTDLFAVIANWPSRRADAWRALLLARAIDCQCWVLGVNRVGEAEGYSHRGDSSLVDPWGAISSTLVDRPGVVVGDVDPDTVRAAREKFHFLRDRKPDLYRRLELGGDDE